MWVGRIRYVVILIFAFFFAYFYGGKIPYMLLYVTAILPVVSVVHLISCVKALELEQGIYPQKPSKGEVVQYICNIRSKSLFPLCYVETQLTQNRPIEGFKELKYRFWILPFGTQKVDQQIKFKYRGTYEFGVTGFRYIDLLGIVSINKKVTECISAVIYPRVYAIGSSEVTNNLLSDTQTLQFNLYEDVASFADLRQYRYGDSMKRIHWKMTARERELMVKNYHGTSQQKVTILLDLQRVKNSEEKQYETEDAMIESALAYALTAVRAWMQVEISYFDFDALQVVRAFSPMEFERIFEDIALKEFNATRDIGESARLIALNSESKTNLVVITQGVDRDLLGEIYKNASYGGSTTLVLCGYENNNKEESEMLKYLIASGVQVLDGNVLLKREKGA